MEETMSEQSDAATSHTSFGSWPQEWRKDLPLLYSCDKDEKQRRRVDHWKDHVTTLAKIACPDGRLGAKRIDILVSHLDILDRRFGALLSFQGLLATVTVFSLAPFSSTLTTLWWGEAAVLGAIAVIWYFDTYHCLRGLGRVIWGDMWAHSNDLVAAEQDQVDRLSESVMMRTARYRTATLLLVLNLLLLALWLLLRVIHVARSGPP
jgi:hypothetical protein